MYFQTVKKIKKVSWLKINVNKRDNKRIRKKIIEDENIKIKRRRTNEIQIKLEEKVTEFHFIIQ